MAFTKWGQDQWGAVWGGSPEELGAISEVEETQALGGNLYLAQDTHGSSPNTMGDVVAGDTIGWVPGRMPMFTPGGDITLVAYNDVSGACILRQIRSDAAGGLTHYSLGATPAVYVYGEIWGDVNVTGLGFEGKPAFLVLTQPGGAGTSFTGRNMPLTNLAAPSNTSVIWNNELGAAPDEIRLTSFTGLGTIIVTYGPSTVVPGSQSFFLKSTFGSGAAAVATEVKVDLRPSVLHEVDLSRFHVVETHNRILIFYYKVTLNGQSATAHFAYSPFHEAYTDDLAFSSSGIVYRPGVLVVDQVPIVSPIGARRHPVSNEILVFLEDEGTENGDEFYCYATRGLGFSSFGPPLVWNAETHPYVFGGRLRAAAPDRKVGIVSVGWTGSRQSGYFSVIGSLSLGITDVEDTDFENFYNTLASAKNANYRRLLLGYVYSPRMPFEVNPGGSHIIRDVTLSKTFQEESKRPGYRLDIDPLHVVSYLKLSDIDGNVVDAEVGNFGQGNNKIVPNVGMVGNSLYFFDFMSQIKIAYQANFDSTSVNISMWVYPETPDDLTGSVNKFTIISREHPGAPNGFLWRLYWVENTGQFRWAVYAPPQGLIDISSSDLSILPRKRWYHITASYDAVNQYSELLVNGMLVARGYFFGGSALPSVPGGGVYIGLPYNYLASGFGSFKGRVNNLAISKDSADTQRRILSFYASMCNKEAPVRASRSNVVSRQDTIIATSSASNQYGSKQVFTACLRKMTITDQHPIRYNHIIDIWRITRDRDAEYMGSLAPAWFVSDRRIAKSEITNYPSTFDSAVESYDICMVPRGNQMSLYVTARQDVTGGAAPQLMVYRILFDPLSVAASSAMTSSYSLVLMSTAATDVMTAFTVIPRTFAGAEEVVVAAITDQSTSAGNRLYVIKENQFGATALAIANKRRLSLIYPASTTNGSFAAFSYASDFGNGTHGPVVRGIVGREITYNLGWSPIKYGGLHLIFGLESWTGAAATPATDVKQIVGTIEFYVPKSSIDLPQAGDFPIFLDEESRQTDEYGFGGLDPFIPLQWVPNPISPTGQSLMLVMMGNRNADLGKTGNGGLSVLSIEQSGTYAHRRVVEGGPVWGTSESKTVGASLALSTSVNNVEDPVQLHIARLYSDSSDKFSTIYASSDEANGAGWTVAAGKSALPLLRRSDRHNSVAWITAKANIRHLTDTPTGIRVKTGKLFRSCIVVRWGATGSYLP